MLGPFEVMEPSARGFSVRSLGTRDFQSAALPELRMIRGNGFRFDASIYSSGYSSQTQELFYLSLSQGDGSPGSPDLRDEGDEGAEGDERGEGHGAGEGIAVVLGGNLPNGAA